MRHRMKWMARTAAALLALAVCMPPQFVSAAGRAAGDGGNVPAGGSAWIGEAAGVPDGSGFTVGVKAHRAAGFGASPAEDVSVGTAAPLMPEPAADGLGRAYAWSWTEGAVAFQDGLCAAVPNGGQVVGEAGGPYNNFGNAVRDMSRMHVSYIDRYWQEPVLAEWDKTVLSGSEWGCFAGKTGLDYIRGHLGYRLFISGAEVSPGSSPDELGVSVGFRNAGFAPLYEDPEVALRLVDAGNRTVWFCRMDHGLSALSGGTRAGDVGTARATVPLEGLEDGTYRIFVDLGVGDAGGGRTPILLANGQDREPDLGYLVGTVTLSTYGAFQLPRTGGVGICPTVAVGGMLSVLSGLALASHGTGRPAPWNDGNGRKPGRRRAEAHRRR